MPPEKRENPIEAKTQEEKDYVDALVALSQDDFRWKAIRWFCNTMHMRIASAQLDLPVHTAEGQASYFLAKGRRIGLFDLITTVEAEVAERKRRNEETFTDLTEKSK